MSGAPKPTHSTPSGENEFVWIAANRPGVYWSVTVIGWLVSLMIVAVVALFLGGVLR